MPRVLVVSRWGELGAEHRFVLRAMAAALSRSAAVDLVVPGTPGGARPDGLFDVHGVGRSAAGGWPEPDAASWPDLPAPDVLLLDTADRGARALAESALAGTPVLALAASPAAVRPGEVAVVTGGEPADRAGPAVRFRPCVPVNPLAGRRPHNALGFTGYLLVLSDRPGTAQRGLTAAAGWLTARFPRRPVVVVEGGRASILRARALRGVVGIDSRTDLWRLMAHAQATVDLAPGPLIARECVESLRYGTPIVVAAGTAGADHARAGGGLWYEGVAQLLGCVDLLDDPMVREILGNQGRQMADEVFGRPAASVEQVTGALEVALGVPPGSMPTDGGAISPR